MAARPLGRGRALASRRVLTDYHLHLQPDGIEPRAEAASRWQADGGHLTAAWIGRYVERARSRAVTQIALTDHVHRFREARETYADTIRWLYREGHLTRRQAGRLAEP